MSCAYLKLINDTFRKCISILFNLHALSSVNQSNANRNPCSWKKMSKPNTTRTGHHGNVQIWYSSFFLVFFLLFRSLYFCIFSLFALPFLIQFSVVLLRSIFGLLFLLCVSACPCMRSSIEFSPIFFSL